MARHQVTRPMHFGYDAELPTVLEKAGTASYRRPMAESRASTAGVGVVSGKAVRSEDPHWQAR